MSVETPTCSVCGIESMGSVSDQVEPLVCISCRKRQQLKADASAAALFGVGVDELSALGRELDEHIRQMESEGRG